MSTNIKDQNIEPKELATDTVRYMCRHFAEDAKPGTFHTKYGSHEHPFTFTEKDDDVFVLETNGYEIYIGVEDDGETGVGVVHEGKIYYPRMLEITGNPFMPFEDHDGVTRDMGAKSAVLGGVTVAAKLGLGVTSDEDVQAPEEEGVPVDLVAERCYNAAIEHSLTMGEVLDYLDIGAAILRDGFLWRKAGRPYELVDGKPEPSNVEPGDLELDMAGLDTVRTVFQDFHQSGVRRVYTRLVEMFEEDCDEDELMSRWERDELVKSGQIIVDAYQEVAEFLGVDKSSLTLGQVFETMPKIQEAK